jgi:hypothetical protein
VAADQALPTARVAARQAALFSGTVSARAKAFAKPFPREELAAERALFMSMIAEPTAHAALADFVSRTDAMPYLARAPQKETH